MKNFKLKALALFLIVFAGANTVSAQAKQEIAGSKIVFDDLTYDFGTVTVGDKGEFEMNFKNGGSEPLILKNVQGCCGASILSYTSDPILPQKSGTIKVKIYTGGAGAVGKTITIHSNDPNNPTLQVRFKGSIKAAE